MGRKACWWRRRDYLKTLPNMISKWMPRAACVAGHRWIRAQREPDFVARISFEVDARFVVVATLHELFEDGQLEKGVLQKAIEELGINPDKPNPVIS